MQRRSERLKSRCSLQGLTRTDKQGWSVGPRMGTQAPLPTEMVMVGTAAAVGTAAVLKVVAAAGFVVVMVVVVVVDRRGAVALRMYVPKVEIEILEGWGGAVGT